MRLFAALTLLAAALFWSHPFLPSGIGAAFRSQATPPRGEPVFVPAPREARVRPSETVASNLTKSSEGPRR